MNNKISYFNYILIAAMGVIVRCCAKGKMNALALIALSAIIIVALIAVIMLIRNMRSLSKPFTGLWCTLVGIAAVSFIVDMAAPEEYDPLLEFYTTDLFYGEDSYEEYEEATASNARATSTFGTILDIAYYIVLSILSFNLIKHYRGKLRTLGVSLIASPIIMYGGLYIFAGYKLLQDRYYTADNFIFAAAVFFCLIMMCIPYMIILDINKNFKESVTEFEKETLTVSASKSNRIHTSTKPVAAPAINKNPEILQGQAPANVVEVVEVVRNDSN